MPDVTTAARFKQARAALGDDVAAVARRAGVSARVVRAIEDGRFEELPPGIYARSSIRSCAVALGLDPDEVFHECEPLLPPLEEPIRAMCRLRGVGTTGRRPVTTEPGESHLAERIPAPDWRPCVAAALDSALVGAILAIVIAGAAVTARVRIDALAGGEGPFGVVGCVLAGLYFVFFGGLCGTTAGARALGLLLFSRESSPLDLREILTRAGRCAAADSSFVWKAGVWLGQAGARTASGASAPKHPGDPRAAVST